MRQVAVLLSLLLAASPAAAGPAPEIRRGPATAQADGVPHTLRTIPEACARLEGVFTGQAAAPYRMGVVRTSANCQPRARFVDAAKVRPDTAAGWVLNDVVRVPSAACRGREAVVRVWRRPAAVAPPALDAQGRARLYLQESKEAAEAKRLPPVPMFAAQMTVEGKACK
jgi:hypothetical protein